MVFFIKEQQEQHVIMTEHFQGSTQINVVLNFSTNRSV